MVGLKMPFRLGLVLLFFLSSRAWAQFERKNQYWGGNIRMFHSTTNVDRTSPGGTDSKYNVHTVSPEIQWGAFLGNKILLGLGSRYTTEWTRWRSNDEDRKSTSHTVYLVPFIRKYKSLGANWAIFLHAELTGGWFQGKSEGQTAQVYWSIGSSTRPGVVYSLPSKKLAIEAYVNVLSLQASYLFVDNSPQRNFNLTAGIESTAPTYFTLRVAKYLSTK